MKSLRIACFVLLLPISVCVPIWGVGKDDPDIAKLQRASREGTWIMLSWEVDGVQMPAAECKKWKMVMKGDDYVLFHDGKENSRGKHQIDVTKKPYHEDFTVTDGDEKGKMLVGIYSVEKKRFTCCYAEKAKGRPGAFRSGPGIILVVWERQQQ